MAEGSIQAAGSVIYSIDGREGSMDGSMDWSVDHSQDAIEPAESIVREPPSPRPEVAQGCLRSDVDAMHDRAADGDFAAVITAIKLGIPVNAGSLHVWFPWPLPC